MAAAVSAQRLGAKALRRIERTIGEPVLRAWAHGGYTFAFVTPDHRHGWWHKPTAEWGWDEGDDVVHYSSCRETWPDYVHRLSPAPAGPASTPATPR